MDEITKIFSNSYDLIKIHQIHRIFYDEKRSIKEFLFVFQNIHYSLQRLFCDLLFHHNREIKDFVKNKIDRIIVDNAKQLINSYLDYEFCMKSLSGFFLDKNVNNLFRYIFELLEKNNIKINLNQEYKKILFLCMNDTNLYLFRFLQSVFDINFEEEFECSLHMVVIYEMIINDRDKITSCIGYRNQEFFDFDKKRRLGLGLIVKDFTFGLY